MSNKRKLGWLKWIMVLLPPVSVWLYETVRHNVLHVDDESWQGNVLAAGLVLVISLACTLTVFGVIERMQARLDNQNQRLKQLNQKVKELAIVEERGRLSREIHDGLAQLLAYLMVKIDTIEGLLKSGRLTEANNELEKAREACNNAYGDVREAIVGLRAELFDDRPFPAILQEMASRFERENNLPVEFKLIGSYQDEYVSAAGMVQLVRVVQQAFANVRKHAAAQHVTITLTVPNANASADSGSDNSLRLTINDDGRGFDAANLSASGQHFGLAIMRERVESLGGRFELQSAAGQGTTVSAVVPVTVKTPSAKAVLG